MNANSDPNEDKWIMKEIRVHGWDSRCPANVITPADNDIHMEKIIQTRVSNDVRIGEKMLCIESNSVQLQEIKLLEVQYSSKRELKDSSLKLVSYTY